MSKRSPSQKIGARGHKWFAAHVEEHPHWLTRDLGEDYGVDLELELHEDDLRGDILKVQIKSKERTERNAGRVKIEIKRKYLDYAKSCRYPVLLVLVDVTAKEAWYVWLQDWLMRQRTSEDPLASTQKSWTWWIDETHTVKRALDRKLKSIARWEDDIQLVLSLLDAMRCAAVTGQRKVVESISAIVASSPVFAGETALTAVIEQAVELGDRMRGTQEGNTVADQLFAIIRHSGNYVTANTVRKLVLRGDSYSRTGLSALEIMYNEYFEHTCALGLAEMFAPLEPRVAFYCAFREAFPEHGFLFPESTDFEYQGLKYDAPENALNKYANRGPSAFLDYLVPIEDES